MQSSLPTPRIGDVRQQTQQRRKCSHGNLRVGCRPRSQTFADSRIRFLSSRFTSTRWCCSPDSLTLTVSVEQPWPPPLPRSRTKPESRLVGPPYPEIRQATLSNGCRQQQILGV